MLEIPLYDMHFGIADLHFYQPALERILQIIKSRHWEQIVIPVGQDLFHNDSITQGVTTKGTPIEKVNLRQAVCDAETFYFNIIDAAIEKSDTVKVFYSPGNHDKTVGWMFSRILKTRYGDLVDDSLDELKAVWWKRCFIGITHGDKKTDNAPGLRGKFSFRFPQMFSDADVREIHTGHLHSEGIRDEFGVQIRRMSTGNKDDEWTSSQGFISMKRFMLFEWQPGKLRSIHFI